MILAGVAVSAVSGCVAVEPHSAPAPVPVPAADTPHLARNVEPQVVQAPAREALDAALPRARSGSEAVRRDAPEARRPAAPPPTPRGQAPAPPAAAAPTPTPPEAAAPGHRVLPALPLPAAGDGKGAGTDVCALGEGYGGWAPDSPQTRICRETYGR